MAGAVERIALIRIDDVISLPAVECFPVGSAAVLAVAQSREKGFRKAPPHNFDSHPPLLPTVCLSLCFWRRNLSLRAMPETGGYVIALPMKIEGGSGAPLRIIGVVPGR